MDSILVQGKSRLCGAVKIQGSKNAVLPILAASLLTKDCSFFENCPKISDVYQMIDILKFFGCEIHWEEKGLYVDSAKASPRNLPEDKAGNMRSTIFLLGALLGAHKSACISRVGGCVIGERSINYHVSALEKMGTIFSWEEGQMLAWTEGLIGADITLPSPSVGATENVILASVLARGVTHVRGCAREPEIVSLCEYLRLCGAKIQGEGTNTIRIQGVEMLHGMHFVIPPDRIVAGTYLFATVATGGNVFLQNAPWRELYAPLAIAEQMGAVYNCSEEGIYIQGPERPKAVPAIVTGPYPEFPTDLQSVALVANCVADGCCKIVETIFENRFRILEELQKMDAQIVEVSAMCAQICGVEKLKGSVVEAKELRGGAALVVAGLCAKGSTTIRNTSFLYRGYENILRDLRELGARVASV